MTDFTTKAMILAQIDQRECIVEGCGASPSVRMFVLYANDQYEMYFTCGLHEDGWATRCWDARIGDVSVIEVYAEDLEE